jgi:outer membrane protein assembly factor BamA
MRPQWLLVFALALQPASAQQRPAPRKPAPAKTGAVPARWPVQSLSVHGNQSYTTQQVLAVAGLKLGQLAGKAEFEAARDRLVASGAFESVGYRFEPSADGSGFAASFQVVEADAFYPVRFQGFSAPDAELRSYLSSRDPLFGAKVPGTAQFVKRYAQALTEKIGEPVAGRVVATGPDQFEIVFRPDRPIPVVANVSFEGNQVIPSPVLNEKISGVAFGTPYSEERFRQLLDTNIRPLYEARGRIRVAFPKIATEPSKQANGIDVKVTVAEGDSFSLNEVRMEGGDTKLLKIADIKTGDIANFDHVNAGIERVKRELARRGFLRAEARADREVHDKAKSVDVVLRVTPGPQYTFGTLKIEGLDIIGEPAVRRIWGLKPGAPYNAEYPQIVLDHIRDEQMFDNLGKTAFSTKIDDASRTVDVTLSFAGAPPPKKEKREY